MTANELRAITFGAFLILASSTAWAQPGVIKLDLVGAAFDHTWRPSLEWALNSFLSVGLGYENGTYRTGGSGSPGSTKEVYKVSGSGITPEVRFYPLEKKYDAPVGMFVGAHYRYRWLTEDYSYKGVESHCKGVSSTFGAHAGYKSNFGNFIIEPVIGYGTVSGKYDEPNDRGLIDQFFISQPDEPIWALRFELSIGLAFPKPVTSPAAAP